MALIFLSSTWNQVLLRLCLPCLPWRAAAARPFPEARVERCSAARGEVRWSDDEAREGLLFSVCVERRETNERDGGAKAGRAGLGKEKGNQFKEH